MLKITATIALAGLALLVIGELLFSRAPTGGREEYYAHAAADLRRSARESDATSVAYHKKVIGMDKSDEPADNSDWLAWHHAAEERTESYAKLAAIDRSKAEQLDNLVQDLTLARAEHLRATRLGGLIVLGAGTIGVLFSAFRNLLPKTRQKVSQVTN